MQDRFLVFRWDPIRKHDYAAICELLGDFFGGDVVDVYWEFLIQRVPCRQDKMWVWQRIGSFPGIL